MKYSPQTLKALNLLAKGEVSAGWFAIEMGYGKGTRRFNMKGLVGASVLKRLAKRGLVHVWDDWFGSAYCTMAELTKEGFEAVSGEGAEGGERVE